MEVPTACANTGYRVCKAQYNKNRVGRQRKWES